VPFGGEDLLSRGKTFRKSQLLDIFHFLFHNYYQMISISGIKYQRELEALPYFNKFAARELIGKTGKNLDKKIERLRKKGYLLSLKKGLYASSVFVERVERKLYQEYLANMLRFPSYLSLEYALAEYGLIPEGILALTSITPKSSRIFANSLGTFIYKNIKPSLFGGFSEKDFLDKKIKIATPAKALFDFLYLRKIVDLRQEITEGLRINWEVFSKDDFREFASFTKKARSAKMKQILEIMEARR